jgi:hypothetical protein
MSRGTFGAVLLLIGAALGVVGGVLWKNEDARIHKVNQTNALVAADDRGSYTPADTNQDPAIVVFAVSGAELLFGMLVIAGMSANEWRAWTKTETDTDSS